MKQYQINSKLMTKSVLYIKTIDDPMKVRVWIQVLDRLGQLKHGHAASGKNVKIFQFNVMRVFLPHLRLSKFQSGNWAKSESNQIFFTFFIRRNIFLLQPPFVPNSGNVRVLYRHCATYPHSYEQQQLRQKCVVGSIGNCSFCRKLDEGF